MSNKELVNRGFPSWEGLFDHLVITHHTNPEWSQDTFGELNKEQRRLCLQHLADNILKGDKEAHKTHQTLTLIL